jgi:hypothetical protein
VQPVQPLPPLDPLDPLLLLLPALATPSLIPVRMHFTASAEIVSTRTLVAVVVRQVENAAWHAALPSLFDVHDSSTAESGFSPNGSSATPTPGTLPEPKKAVVHGAPDTDEHDSQKLSASFVWASVGVTSARDLPMHASGSESQEPAASFTQAVAAVRTDGLRMLTTFVHSARMVSPHVEAEPLPAHFV